MKYFAFHCTIQTSRSYMSKKRLNEAFFMYKYICAVLLTEPFAVCYCKIKHKIYRILVKQV